MKIRKLWTIYGRDNKKQAAIPYFHSGLISTVVLFSMKHWEEMRKISFSFSNSQCYNEK